MKNHILSYVVILLLIMGSLGVSSCGLENTDLQNGSQVLPADTLVLVNGKSIEFEAYNINGNNYFKLRDVAMALNGSSKQFEIIWDASENAVKISTRKPYTVVGGELGISKSTDNINMVSSTSRVFVNAVLAKITVYNINGNNYFKLRDLGSLIDFGISWNDAENIITIETSLTYSETVDKMSFGNRAYFYVEYIQNKLNMRIAGTPVEKSTATYLESELKKSGYDSNQLETQGFEFKNDEGTFGSQNIIATKGGKDAKVIIVGAHYDSVNTHGVDDNGSGVAVVLENAARLVNEEVPYTIKFVFFGAEESGFSGSAYYVNSLSPEDQKNILMMINLDSILAGDKQYIFSGEFLDDGSMNNNWAVQEAKKTADNLGLSMYLNPVTDPKMSPANRSDHVNFKNVGIPCVFFWSGNLDILPYKDLYQTTKLGKIFHTGNDNLAVINKYFEGRAQERLTNYSMLLYHILKETQ